MPISQEQAMGWLVLLFFIMSIVQFFAGRLYQRNKERDENNPPPLTDEEFRELDDLPSGVAVTIAWAQGKNRKVVRSQMPVLGRALDRMTDFQYTAKDK